MFEVRRIGNQSDLTWDLRSGQKAVRAMARVLQNGTVETWVGGIPFLASVQRVAVAGPPVQANEALERPYGGSIHALMPGRVTSVLVKENDHVDIGSPLLILEAMKMQNEISSPMIGHVKSIRVKEGETVKKDAFLMEIG